MNIALACVFAHRIVVIVKQVSVETSKIKFHNGLGLAWLSETAEHIVECQLLFYVETDSRCVYGCGHFRQSRLGACTTFSEHQVAW